MNCSLCHCESLCGSLCGSVSLGRGCCCCRVEDDEEDKPEAPPRRDTRAGSQGDPKLGSQGPSGGDELATEVAAAPSGVVEPFPATRPRALTEQVIPCSHIEVRHLRVRPAVPGEYLDEASIQTFQFDSNGRIHILDSTSPYFPEVRCSGRFMDDVMPNFLSDVLFPLYSKTLSGGYYRTVYRWRDVYHLVSTYPVFGASGEGVQMGVMTAFPYSGAIDGAQNLQPLGEGHGVVISTPRRQAMATRRLQDTAAGASPAAAAGSRSRHRGREQTSSFGFVARAVTQPAQTNEMHPTVSFTESEPPSPLPRSFVVPASSGTPRTAYAVSSCGASSGGLRVCWVDDM